MKNREFYKSLNLLSLVAVLSFLCCAPNAFAGGESSGGGDPRKIDEAAIKLLLQGNDLKKAMVNYLETIQIDKISDPQVSATFARIMQNQALTKDILNGHYVTGSTCKDAYSHSVPASTLIGIRGAGICFNTSKIAEDLKGLSQEDGMIRLASLAFHEHVHHFQSNAANADQNEAEAYQLAGYVQLTAKIVQVPLLKWQAPSWLPSSPDETFGALPVLHQIREFTFSTPYSCSGSYETSALFLTEYSRSRNAPELLYNGACRSEDYVEASTGGDDFTLIADLGDIQLEDLTASKAFNWQNIVGFENTFKAAQVVTKNHTYAVLISKSDIRALYAFKVIDQSQDGAMTIRYVVKSYSIQHTNAESSGFDWEAKNH